MENILKRFCAVFVLLFIVLQSSVTAFALNSDYLYREKWINNKNVTLQPISVSSVKGTLSGSFGYYIDESSMAVYTYFQVKENTYKSDSEIIVRYDYTTPSEKYCVSIDKNGLIVEGKSENEKMFDVQSNFTFNESNGCFISAAQYNGNESSCSVDIFFSVNGHIYQVKDGISVVRPVTTKAEKTTKPSGSTKASAKSKSSAEKTTKFVAKGSANKYRQNSTSPKTTKTPSDSSTFTPDSNIISKGSSSDSSLEAFKNPSEIKTSVKFSELSKIIMLVAGFAAISGIILIIVSLLKKESAEPQENPTDETASEEE